MNQNTRLRLCWPLLATLSVLAGCGSSSDTATPPTGPATASNAKSLGPSGTLVWAVTSDPSPGAENSGPTPDPWAGAVAMDDTALYVFGSSVQSTGLAWRLEKRSLVDGSLVPTFGSGGVLAFTPSTKGDSPADIAVADDGLYLIGTINQEKSRIEKRSKTDGSLIASFGNAGSSDETAKSIGFYSRLVLGSDGIFVELTGASGYDANIAKFDRRTGALDTSFRGAGIGSWSDFKISASALASSESALYLAATSPFMDPDAAVWAIQKMNRSDGKASVGFGDGNQGTVQEAFPEAQAASLTDMAVATDALFVVGYTLVSEPTPDASTSETIRAIPRIERRNLDTGVLDPTFGSGGAIDGPTATAYYSVAADDALYVLGDQTVDGAVQVRLEKRNRLNGSLVSSFGNGGVYTSSSAPRTQAATFLLALDAVYWVGADNTPGYYQWRIEKIAR